MKTPGADGEAAKLTPEYGGGYIGFLEVSHHLHVSTIEGLKGRGLTRDQVSQPSAERGSPGLLHG
jgi:hypothetical protein